MNRLKQILLIAAMVLLPSLCFGAGTLIPAWEATMTKLAGQALTGLAGGSRDLGTIDMGSYYVVEIYANVVEAGANPTGSAGVSVYLSGATDGAVPISVWTVNATSLKDHSAVGDTTTGITKTWIFENVREITIGAGYDNAADKGNFTVNINYKRMTGYYN